MHEHLFGCLLVSRICTEINSDFLSRIVLLQEIYANCEENWANAFTCQLTFVWVIPKQHETHKLILYTRITVTIRYMLALTLVSRQETKTYWSLAEEAYHVEQCSGNINIARQLVRHTNKSTPGFMWLGKALDVFWKGKMWEHVKLTGSNRKLSAWENQEPDTGGLPSSSKVTGTWMSGVSFYPRKETGNNAIWLPNFNLFILSPCFHSCFKIFLGALYIFLGNRKGLHEKLRLKYFLCWEAVSS